MAKANRAYHNFFEGYSEFKETLPNGKQKIRRVYTGTWYIADQNKKTRILFRVLYFVIFLISALLFIIAASAGNLSNRTWYPTIPVVAAVFCFLWQLRALCYYIPVGERTIYHYRTSSFGIKHSASALSICMGCRILLQGVFLLINASSRTASELICLSLFLVIGLLQLLLRHAERRVTYRTRKSTEQILPD